MPKFVEKLLRVGEGRVVKKLAVMAKQVNALEDDFERLSDAELREETDRFKARISAGETLDELLPEAFATVREASLRRPDDGWGRPAPRQHRRDAHR